MPMLMTEIEQGQKAALNLDLNPYRAQAELERIPLETQKLQQALETGKTNQATAALQLKVLLGEEQSNTQFKTAVEQLVKSGGLDSTRPISEQALKLSKLAYEQGNFELGRKFSVDGERATQHEAQAEANNYKIEQRKLSTFGTMAKLWNPDGSNFDATIDDALKTKLLQPQQLEGIRQQGKQALANGPGAFVAWQTDLTKKLRTFEEQRLALEEARITAKAVRDEKKDDLAERRFLAVLSQRGAARTSGDDKAAVRLDTTMLKSARDQIERIEDNIQNIDRDLIKLPKVTYETGLFGSIKLDEQGNRIPNADPDQELRAELTGRRAVLRKRLQTYKQEEARALKNLRKDGGSDEAPEPAARATPSAAAPIVAAPAASSSSSGLIRPADVPRDWVVQQDSKGNRVWASPDGTQFTPIISPPTSDSRTSAAAPSNNSGGRLTSAQQQDAISRANVAIAKGADPVKVRQRLREAGISLKD